MPTPLPSSFASAAAGNAHDSSNRRDGPTSGEWARTRMNGATQTFRRPSQATNPSHSRDTSQTTTSTNTPSAGAYIPPHMAASHQSGGLRNGTSTESRYSKEQLLTLYKTQRDMGTLGKNVTEYFVAEFNPLAEVSPVNGHGSWGKREDAKDTAPGPEVCWDHGGHVEPLGLIAMTDDEKELFSNSVNSPLKPPSTNVAKENAGSGIPGRKTSISYSQNLIGAFNPSSPSGPNRPGARRRETSDAAGNPMPPTPGGSRFFRDEPNTSTPPSSLIRRKTDFRDTPTTKADDREKEAAGRESGGDTASPFGSLKRSVTNPFSAGLNGPSSPWSSAPQTSNFSPMGAFGAFSLGSNTAQSPTVEKRPGFGSLRGESRFKGLLSKDSSEDIGSTLNEKSSMSNLERLTEVDTDERSRSPWAEPAKTRAGRSETNPFAEEGRSGSAALGGSQETSAPAQNADALGLGAFGMTSSIPGFRDLMQNEGSRHNTPGVLAGHEPTSPTNTNPYQSPHGEKADAEDVDTDGSDVAHHPGISGLRDTAGPFGSIRRVGSGADLPAIDRSATSSATGTRSFSGLGGLGGFSGLGGSAGWPSSAATGTPSRERSAFSSGFADPIFGSMGGDLQSPNLSSLGGVGLFGPHTGFSGAGSIGRSSKLGSLFPAAMQEQMQGDQTTADAGNIDEGNRQADPQHQPASTSAGQTPVSAVGSVPAAMASAHENTGNFSQPIGPPSSSSVPPAQQRTMVMPDRMRWIYRDPQGNIQGPWTGLEMHDWFKAGFFSPDLQIKKLEDTEFEPLAQLVRRIGNSREPFLVPQIGIPHGPDPNPIAWAGAGPAPSTGSAQPPFPGSFPSFGTTLTAEQQNALERRKQEEQYLMARQKEHLAQQQAMMKQMQLQGVPSTMHSHQLQHHSSAHSLHSQPSFGSIASPVGYQPSPIQGPNQQQQNPSASGFFDGVPMRQNALSNVGSQMLGTDIVGSQDQLPALLDRLNVSRPDPFAFGSSSSFGVRQPDSLSHQQQVTSMLQDRAQLQQEQEQFDNAHADALFDQEAREERLRQFQALRAQEGDMSVRTAEGLPTHPATDVLQQHEAELMMPSTQPSLSQPMTADESTLTLSQQVQQAASAQKQQQQQQQQQQHEQQQMGLSQAQSDAVWRVQTETGMPNPFPPPPSASPLPAPAAQRNRANVAESLAAGSRSQTQTPIETPTVSIAPWAKEVIEVPKGPSLREIQEAEARTAAQREELASAARRAQLLAEQERLSQAQAQTPGLPSSANWASAGSPATPTSTSSAWTSKGPAAPASAATKKTLAQIQKEEEARKQRLAAASQMAAVAATTVSSTGKRYADLASKAPAPVPSPGAPGLSSAWTTVGAGGKAKAPPAAPLGPRSTSATVPVTGAAAKPRPAAAPRTATIGTTPAANPTRAMEEFTKWAKISLGKGLNSGINVDDFVQQLLLLPTDSEIISDSVYANSQTLDGRRFAEEFIRRRKLADKGIADPVSASALADPKNAGGWNEVAKKSTVNANANVHREEDSTNAAFKVVAARKKGKK